MAEFERLIRSQLSPEEGAEVQRVSQLAQQLLSHLESSMELITALHIHGAQSRAIQDTVGRLEDQLGFGSEVVLAPQDGLVTGGSARHC